MGRKLIKAGVGASVLLVACGSATAAFAIRNRYTQEQSSELGIAIMQAFDARDSEGRPVRIPRYPSEFYGQAPSSVRLGDAPFGYGR